MIIEFETKEELFSILNNLVICGVCGALYSTESFNCVKCESDSLFHVCISDIVD